MRKNHLITVLTVAGLLFAVNKALHLMDYDKYHVFISLSGFVQMLLVLLAVAFYFAGKKNVIIVNILVFFILLVLLEVICYFLSGMPAKKDKNFHVPDYATNHIGYHVGYVPYADSVYREVKIDDNDTVFNVRNTIDRFNRRVTPGHDSTKKQYALFFGCSICFGYGLEDNKTFPYYFQTNASEYNSYNYGYPGYGTQQMLARFEFNDLSKEVGEKEGICVYVFFWGHIERTVGAMNIYTDWGYDTPYYAWENGQVVRQGKFSDGRVFISTLYEWVYQLNIIKYFQINFPLWITDEHLILTAEIIKKSKELYSRQFGNDRFYVLIYPNWKETQKKEDLEKFMKHLKERNISCIDMSNVIEYGKSYTLGGDPHPSARTNEMLSKKFIEALKIN